MRLRRYADTDAAPTRALFERAVWISAAGDYSEAQRRAWAPAGLDPAGLAAWAAARSRAHTIVATDDDGVIGFSDLLDGRKLDHLYVDPRSARRGVGCALIAEVLRVGRAGGATVIETDASLTARPLFERHGFVVVAEQTPVLRGVAMTNFRMTLELDAATSPDQ